jgi:hypothetical protein
MAKTVAAIHIVLRIWYSFGCKNMAAYGKVKPPNGWRGCVVPFSLWAVAFIL